MRRLSRLMSIAVLLVLCSYGYAQDRGKTYLNLNYSSAKLSQPATEKISNKFGIGLTVGHTYFLHREPVADLFWFGLDATWFDINYNNFSYSIRGDRSFSEETIHEGEVGMHVGPSVTMIPVDKLKIKGYFRFAPSCAFLYDTDGEKPSFNFAPMFVGGLSVNYGIIGAGFEARFGSTKLQEYYMSEKSHKDRDKVSTDISGFRVYINVSF